MSQIPDGKLPQFDLAELDDVKAMAQRDAIEGLPDPQSAPQMQMPQADQASSPSEGGGFDSGEELLGAVHNLNTSVQQVVQMLQRLLGE